ncbi:hypothetical protein OSB04_005989 [Centaurea solstitialis]|uniref:Retrovirus-related Pol polyprotein from transposon TNT 1-94-like beta-barrel domain-containing protein n=1 Tax=Centaurea solstitialis TaxID=347529 RepID=A0AA38TIU2_9ASTR|nr:hypothetical protein OSB04_005989 [Centaurea solstitialis]
MGGVHSSTATRAVHRTGSGGSGPKTQYPIGHRVGYVYPEIRPAVGFCSPLTATASPTAAVGPVAATNCWAAWSNAAASSTASVATQSTAYGPHQPTAGAHNSSSANLLAASHRNPMAVEPSPPWTWAPPDQATALPELFNTMSLNDPGSTDWYMDTRATDHVHTNAGILNSILDKHDTRSILVGNGSHMPVVTTGHSPFPLQNPYRPLHLRNILISPAIIKNLIFVRQFTRQNKTSIEFDSFGFTVKDYKTRHPLI